MFNFSPMFVIYYGEYQGGIDVVELFSTLWWSTAAAFLYYRTFVFVPDRQKKKLEKLERERERSKVVPPPPKLPELPKPSPIFVEHVGGYRDAPKQKGQ